MNKYLLADKSQLLKKKLELLTTTLAGNLGNVSLQTREEYLFEATRILNEFYRGLTDPKLNKEDINAIRTDDLPDDGKYNLLWQQVLDDLVTVFTELENIETLSIANFNFITTEANRLTARLKSVDSKLGDYILYSLSPNKDTYFFKDSFNDLSKIEVNSSLVNGFECEIDQVEGIVTLPVDRLLDSKITIRELPIINANSNGAIGNNQEIGVPFNGSISVLLDNNPDTWFEYEKVVSASSEDTTPLVLDITMNLGEESVVNHIRVNPNNFGTKTVIQIDEIATSIDGKVYVSIKDDIPIAGFTTQDEENVFNLAPSTSKFAGQGLYTFTPRKVRYIRFVFKQTEFYPIDTPSGEMYRYAIGIRDIEILGINYVNKGEVVSKPFISTLEIRKVMLDTNQNPTQVSELASIQYYVSPNSGASWYEIQPKKFVGPIGIHAVPEVINFNTGDADAIITPVPVKELRVKAVFTRKDEFFKEGASSLNKKVATTSELHVAPQAAPFNIELQKPPIDGTVMVIDPLFGSRGIETAQYIVGHAQDRLNMSRYRLPFEKFPHPVEKISDNAVPPTYYTRRQGAASWLHVEVGGEEWTHATQPLTSYTLDFNDLDTYKLFTFNSNTGILTFGDGLTNTMQPTDSQPISIYFEAEQLFPNELTDNHIALLDFKTSSNKDDFVIKRYGETATFSEVLPRGATVIHLTNQNIIDYTNIGYVLNNNTNLEYTIFPVTFLNGKDELLTDYDWSIDIDNGIIYLKSPLDRDRDLNISYTYTPIATLTTDDWDWATTTMLKDSIAIKESGWKTIEVVNELSPANSEITVWDLAHLGVVKGTLKFKVQSWIGGNPPPVTLTVTDSDNAFVKEVPFINGVEEFGGQFSKTTETIPRNLTPVANDSSFDLKENISTRTTQHIVAFSNTTYFNDPKNTANDVTNQGDYFIDRVAASLTYGKVYFYQGTVTNTDFGTITYYYASPNNKDNGLYSVDYKLGKVYTQRTIYPNNSNDYEITCNYQYTDYRAEYRIARFMDLKSYDVDITNRKVTIKDSEVLKHIQTPRSGMDSRLPIYLINYDYVQETKEDVMSLKPKFTPILKDYALRVLTKSRTI